MRPLTIFDSSSIKEGSVAQGIVITVALNLLQVVLIGLISSQFAGGGGSERELTIFVVGLSCAGLIQLIYIVPLYFYFKRKEKTETAKGLVIAASVVILINVACWGGFGWGK